MDQVGKDLLILTCCTAKRQDKSAATETPRSSRLALWSGWSSKKSLHLLSGPKAYPFTVKLRFLRV